MIQLETQRLRPQVQLKPNDVAVEVGGSAEMIILIEGADAASQQAPPLQIEAGAVIVAEVANQGGSLLEVAVAVDGLDADWYARSITSLGLMPGDRGEIEIVIRPPTDAPAGVYPFEVCIWGTADGRDGRFVGATSGNREDGTVSASLVVGDGGFKVVLVPHSLSLESEGKRARARLWMPSAPAPERRMEITVEGIEDSWVTVSPCAVTVRPEESCRVLLVFHPPRDCPDQRLGQQNFVVNVREPDRNLVHKVGGILRVLPFGGQIMQSSYLQYLPSIYSTDPMVGRLLLVFESVLEPIEQVIDQIAQYFDPELAPESFVPWLASWVALALDEKLPMQQRRLLVKRAMELYRWRGTRRGLKEAVELSTGARALIVENFDGLTLDAEARLGLNTRLGRRQDYHIVVTLVIPDDRDPRGVVDVARTIIEENKPAHLGYILRVAPRVAGGR